MSDWNDEIPADEFFKREEVSYEPKTVEENPETPKPPAKFGERAGVFFGGLMFLGIGSFFCFFVLCGIHWRDYLPWEKIDTPAKITSVKSANLKINGRKILRYQFSGTSPEGEAISGESCSSNTYSQNDTVRLERQENVYRIQSTTLGTMSGLFAIFILLFVLIFPMVGLFLLWTALFPKEKTEPKEFSAENLDETETLEREVPDLRLLPDPEYWYELRQTPRQISLGARMGLTLCGQNLGCFGWFWLVFTTIFLALMQHANKTPQTGDVAEGVPFFAWAIIGIFAIIGLILIGATIRSGRQALWLLQNGTAVKAWAKSAEPTGVSVNEQKQYRIEYLFLGQDSQPHLLHATTFSPGARLADDCSVVLYNPDKTNSDAILLEEILRTRVNMTQDVLFRLRPDATFQLLVTLALAAIWVLTVVYLVTGQPSSLAAVFT